MFDQNTWSTWREFAAGNYSLGQEWYAKAVERGATVDSVDQDLRNIFHRADQAKKAEMREFLLREDAVRYSWVSGNTNTQKQRREARN